MRRLERIPLLLAVLSLVVLPLTAWAQAVPPPATPAAPPGAPAAAAPAAGSGAGAATVIVVVLALLIVVGIGVKLYDLKRKREAEAVHLQAQVSDALLREPALFGLPITPTAHVSVLKSSPAVIEVAGQVPTPQLRDAALRIIRAEAERVRPDFEVEDRLTVVPSMATRSA